jgi:hypothetical protein
VAIMAKVYVSDDMDDSDEIDVDASLDDLGGETVEAPGRRGEDAPEVRSVTSRCRIREQLNHDIEAYLASGGAIHPAENRWKSDAAHNPGGHYGSHSH